MLRARDTTLAVLSLLVLATDLVLLLRREVVLDVKRRADLLRRLALNYISDGLAANIEEGLNVEVVGG